MNVVYFLMYIFWCYASPHFLLIYDQKCCKAVWGHVFQEPVNVQEIVMCRRGAGHGCGVGDGDGR